MRYVALDLQTSSSTACSGCAPAPAPASRRLTPSSKAARKTGATISQPHSSLRRVPLQTSGGHASVRLSILVGGLPRCARARRAPRPRLREGPHGPGFGRRALLILRRAVLRVDRRVGACRRRCWCGRNSRGPGGQHGPHGPLRRQQPADGRRGGSCTGRVGACQHGADGFVHRQQPRPGRRRCGGQCVQPAHISFANVANESHGFGASPPSTGGPRVGPAWGVWCNSLCKSRRGGSTLTETPVWGSRVVLGLECRGSWRGWGPTQTRQ